MSIYWALTTNRDREQSLDDTLVLQSEVAVFHASYQIISPWWETFEQQSLKRISLASPHQSKFPTWIVSVGGIWGGESNYRVGAQGRWEKFRVQAIWIYEEFPESVVPEHSTHRVPYNILIFLFLISLPQQIYRETNKKFKRCVDESKLIIHISWH